MKNYLKFIEYLKKNYIPFEDISFKNNFIVSLLKEHYQLVKPRWLIGTVAVTNCGETTIEFK